jgi:hypothetical protein
MVSERVSEVHNPTLLSLRLTRLSRDHIIIIGYGNLGRRIVDWALDRRMYAALPLAWLAGQPLAHLHRAGLRAATLW